MYLRFDQEQDQQVAQRRTEQTSHYIGKTGVKAQLEVVINRSTLHHSSDYYLDATATQERTAVAHKNQMHPVLF